MKHTLLIVFLLSFSFVFSQADYNEEEENALSKLCKEVDKEAFKLYEKGSNKKKYHKPERMAFLKQALEIDPDFAEANLRMGWEIIVHLKLENKPFTSAMPYFMKAIAHCPEIHSEPFYYLGYAYYELVNNDSAKKYLEKFLAFKVNDENKYAKDYAGELNNAKEMLKQVKKENALFSKPKVPFDPKVVKGVSTPSDEYLAYVSPDDKNCYFVRRVPYNSKDKVYQSDKEKELFMRATRDATGVFDKGEPMDWPFNETEDNQGGCTISIDNKNLYFAMMRFEGGSQPNCDIYVSKNVDGAWKPIQKLSPVVNHPVYWDSQPTLSADGNSIIFASDRPGGYGGIDLYITTKDPVTKQWGTPLNLGSKINTAGDEKTPFIHSDSETLYFSSKDGHFGFGGYDIFYARKDASGNWMEPVNIGAPINSSFDDTGFFVSSDAQTGYFFSDNTGKVLGKGIGKSDLYSFPLYKEARPQATTFLKVSTKDSYDGNLRGAEVEITNVLTKEKVATLTDSITGEATAAINEKNKDADLLVTLKKKDYAFTSTKIKLNNVSPVNPPKEIQLISDETKVGTTFVLNNIYYNTNSAELKDESKIVLEAFAKYLKENKKIKIEIQGHTDNVGSESDNQALSANRAFTVKQTLESYGIDADRITERGFGSSKPISDNKTETGRAKNRRTEFEILSNE